MPASFGTNCLGSSFGLIISNWIALIPLVLYLGQPRLAPQLVGRTALAGCIPSSLFPQLGVLRGMAEWLREGARYMDWYVTEPGRIIWNAGFKRKCQGANGAASDILTQRAVRTAEEVDIPQNLEEARAKYVRQGTERSDKGVKGNGPHRPRMLYIINCTLNTDEDQASKESPWGRILRAGLETAILLGLVGISVIAVLFGMYGTAAALVIGAVFRVARLLIPVPRLQDYMNNNQPNMKNAHMLASDYAKANTWYLYTGPRGIVDGLLNKSMISAASPLGRNDHGAAAATAATALLPTLVGLQVATMMYVAAQGGWDAFGLLAVVLLAWRLDRYLYSEDRLAERWLRAEGVRMKALACRFSGRVPMIGAVQVLKRPATRTKWMDKILVPMELRDIWLEKLREHDLASRTPAAADDDTAAGGRPTPLPFWLTKEGQKLTDEERNGRIWVEDNYALTCAAVDAIKAKMGRGNA
ncbi:hypothetical protein ISF_02034 [Cordyceps fumosorosea ARSEF 2679]|uniref:Uncharacterized protein n=1 Tax=Cordyceps fumosorosea (strain ARSEF 2679) TaxID=1081104 RepID=A0A168CKC1_CORFA|nr:hypothetical protein ISF_02034 [Cordyceps fumosorosea ARSEF 2679]OAA71483.1 hypothetical protein ISF_02034 [Cordyceps fumosorosea ARSEF 2679]